MPRGVTRLAQKTQAVLAPAGARLERLWRSAPFGRKSRPGAGSVAPSPSQGAFALRFCALFAARAGLDPKAVEEALDAAQSQAHEGAFFPVFVASGLLPELEIIEHAAAILGLTALERVPDELLDYALVKPFPIAHLKANPAVPIKSREGGPEAVLSDPFNLAALDDFRAALGEPFERPFLAPAEAVLSAINRVYGSGSEAGPIVWDMRRDEEASLVELDENLGEDLLDESNSAPVIKAVNLIIAKAVKSKASDIHIEAGQTETRIRYRLDGVLHQLDGIPKNLHAAVLSRIKIMARLNIAEKRLPQDGRIEVKLGERLVDLRVSTIPTTHGERTVLRLLEKSAKLLSLDDLGLSSEGLATMRQALGTSHGVILTTGPTGSGKTTTLYSAINHIKSPDLNIMTIEDPVEYQIEGISQMQVNAKIGLTFAAGLRAMVRQDPDVILIGEIRDQETAGIAIQAAMTGHLVFSTLHTNDAATAMTRLIDMGLEPFQLSSVCRTVIAQRLIRVLCPHCKAPHPPTSEELAELRLSREQAPEFLYGPVGCVNCFNTGYKGRTAIYEIMRMTENIQELVLRKADANQIRQMAISEGMRALRLDGVRKVLLGLTTVRELARVTSLT